MIQKEVAQRIVAKPNSKTFGILSVLSQFYADVKIIFDVSRNVFYPKPDVTSTVVCWNFKQHIQFPKEKETLFREIVKKTFSQRRKMLRNSLKLISTQKIDFNRLKFDLEKRPEQLTVTDFINLTDQISLMQAA